MADAIKVLGQRAPAAGGWENLGTVGAGKSWVASTLSICNRGAAAALVRVAVRPAGAVLANAHYLVYDVSVAAKDTVFLTIGLTLAATDVIDVYSSTADCSFSLFGTEVS